VEAVHDTEERWIRDLPLLGTPVQLLVHRCRLACPQCGPKLEHLDWLGRYQRVTCHLAESAARLARVLPLQHVADYFGLHWGTVKEIDKHYLEETLDNRQLRLAIVHPVLVEPEADELRVAEQAEAGKRQIVKHKLFDEPGHQHLQVACLSHTRRAKEDGDAAVTLRQPR
jgi:hypothetical protein